MTAPAINPAISALPGPGGPAGLGALGSLGGRAGHGQAAGPLAGFEALLAALFGGTDIAGAPVAAPNAGAPGTAPSLSGAEPAPAGFPAGLLAGFEADPEAAAHGEDPAPEAPGDAASAALAPILDPAIGVPPPAAPATTTDVKTTGATTGTTPGTTDGTTNGATPAGAAPTGPQAAASTAEAQVSAQAQAQAQAGPNPTHADTPTGPQPAATPQAVAAPSSQPPAPASQAQTAAAPPPEALAQTAAREEITRAADAPPATPSAKKDRKAADPARVDVAAESAAEPEAPTDAAPAARRPAVAGAGPNGVAKPGGGVKAAQIEVAEPDARRMDLPEALERAHGQAERAGTDETARAAPTPATHAVRGSPETLATLAAQIVKKLEGRSTRFDLELDPAGLGKVDVRIEIGAHGRLAAALSFDNPQAAAELKARSADLHRALEQAGFDVSGGLSFDVAGDRGGEPWGQARQDWNDSQGGFGGRAFQQALEAADEADMAVASGELRLRRGVTAGVDVRI